MMTIDTKSTKTDMNQTAHQAWDSKWLETDVINDWSTPDPQVSQRVAFLKGRNIRSVCDLGCGIGRHAIMFAREGFEVWAYDASVNAINYVKEYAVNNGLKIKTDLGLMTSLPYDDNQFDYLIAFNVVHHGDPDIIASTVAEIKRVVRVGGIIQGTMLSKRNAQFGRGRLIAPDTYIIDGAQERGHPHFYCSAKQLIKIFNGFEIIDLQDREQKKAGSFHWHFIMERTL